MPYYYILYPKCFPSEATRIGSVLNALLFLSQIWSIIFPLKTYYLAFPFLLFFTKENFNNVIGGASLFSNHYFMLFIR